MDRLLGGIFFGLVALGCAYYAVAYDRKKHGDLDASGSADVEGCLVGCLLGPILSTELGTRILLGVGALAFALLAVAVLAGWLQ